MKGHSERTEIELRLRAAGMTIVEVAKIGNDNDRAMAECVVAAFGAWVQGNAAELKEKCQRAVSDERRITLQQLEPGMN